MFMFHYFNIYILITRLSAWLHPITTNVSGQKLDPVNPRWRLLALVFMCLTESHFHGVGLKKSR